MQTGILVIGSRGSRLALAQAEEVIDGLSRKFSARIGLSIIKTKGDRQTRKGTGIFVRELERALLAGEINIAVHSLKDLLVALPDGLEIAACTARADFHDVLVSRDHHCLSSLPGGATVGTGSPRRRAQLLHSRPDLKVVPIRGNVDSRISLVESGRVDAVVLAAAGLGRLGLQELGVRIPLEMMLPAPGQGALALEVRSTDETVKRWAGTIDDEITSAATAAERALLKELGGGCHTPLGALAEVHGKDEMSLWARLLYPTGKLQAEVKVTGSPQMPLKLARQAAREIKIKADGGFPR